MMEGWFRSSCNKSLKGMSTKSVMMKGWNLGDFFLEALKFRISKRLVIAEAICSLLTINLSKRIKEFLPKCPKHSGLGIIIYLSIWPGNFASFFKKDFYNFHPFQVKILFRLAEDECKSMMFRKVLWLESSFLNHFPSVIFSCSVLAQAWKAVWKWAPSLLICLAVFLGLSSVMSHGEIYP